MPDPTQTLHSLTREPGAEAPYLAIPVEPWPSAGCDPWQELRARGLVVLVEHDEHQHRAFEILASREQASSLLASTRFSICARGPVQRDAIAPGAPWLDPVLERWNAQFLEDYAQQHRTHAEDIAPVEKLGGKRLEDLLPENLVVHAQAIYEKILEQAPAGVFPFMRLASSSLLAPGTPDAGDRPLACMVRADAPRPSGQRWYLTGRVGVSVFVVDVENHENLRFSHDEASCIAREVLDGLSWLAQSHPAGALTFTCAFHRASVDLDPRWGSSVKEIERNLLVRAVKEIDQDRGPSEDLGALVPKHLSRRFRDRNTDYQIAIFITSYRNDGPLSEKPKIMLAKCRNWYGRGLAQLDGMIAHEVLHAFGGLDEYVVDPAHPPCAGADAPARGVKPAKMDTSPWNHGKPSARITTLLMKGVTVLIDPDVLQERSTDGDPSKGIPNNNYIVVARPHQPCIMGYYPRQLCEYTKAQIGWVDLLVELETRGNHFSGTDSQVWLDIGWRAFELDIREHDDRWPGHRAAYGFYGIEPREIRRLMLRKAPGGFWHAWEPVRMRVWYRNELIYDYDGRDGSRGAVWLDDRVTVWLGPDSGWVEQDRCHDPSLVHSLVLEIISSGALAGDEIEIAVGGRRWILGPTAPEEASGRRVDRFNLDPGTGLSAALQSMEIRRLTSGARNGWQFHDLRLVCNGVPLGSNALPAVPPDGCWVGLALKVLATIA